MMIGPEFSGGMIKKIHYRKGSAALLLFREPTISLIVINGPQFLERPVLRSFKKIERQD
jgi:hypothetical protein